MRKAIHLGIVVVLVLACAVIFVTMPRPAMAQEADTCVDVEEDRAIATGGGFEWIGVVDLPLGIQVPGGGMVFYRKGGVIFASPVFEGCVSPNITPVGPDAAQPASASAPAVPPAPPATPA